MKRIEEARDILKELQVPVKQQSDMCCYVLLAMAQINKRQAWADATNNWIRIHDIIGYIKEQYDVEYAENSRETIRKQALHHYRNAAFIEDSMPKWGEDTNKAIIIASLLGKWTECKGDIEIIEKLFENSYSEFMEYLLQYMGSESAFIIRKTDYFNNYTIYELSDPFLAVQLHKSIITIDSACDFLKLAIDVLSERSNKFDNPFSGFNIISGEESSKYSSALKHGISRTLILLSLYCDCQNEVDNCVRTILLSINRLC